LGVGVPPARSSAPTPPTAAKAKNPQATPPAPPFAAPVEPSTPPARPSPAAPAALTVPAEVSEQEAVIRLGDRRYRVRGLAKNLAYDVLKINLLASRRDAFHVDTLDLYSARHRAVFQKAAAGELGVDDRDPLAGDRQEGQDPLRGQIGLRDRDIEIEDGAGVHRPRPHDLQISRG
jgi:hypothetical protein